ncbi:S-layer homology domain-containing protein [Paenibacillus sp. y28]|uniref:S-layer homology domain-containing protein n=1 Tax=Paenibacillus sp. y28 TaxID=3129110 RepID=UPI00301662D6
MNKKTWLQVLVLALLIGMANPTQIWAAADPAFTASFSAATVKVGNQVVLTVSGQQVQDLYGYEVKLGFDSNMLKLIKAEGPSTGGESFVSSQTGTEIQFVHTKIGQVGGDNGNVTLGSFTFQVLASGSTNVNIKEITTVGSGKQEAAWTPDYNTALFARKDDNRSSSGSESSGGSGNGGNTSASPEILQQGGNVKIIKSPQLDPDTGAVLVKLDEDTLEKAKALGGRIIIEVPGEQDAKQYSIQIPANLYSSGSQDHITIVTALGTMEVPANLLGNTTIHSAEEVGFALKQADTSALSNDAKLVIGSKPAVQIGVTVDGAAAAYNNPQAPVTVSIPYQPSAAELNNPEHIVIVMIDAQGNAQPVPSGRYDAASGTVIFETTRDGTFAVGYVEKEFVDLNPVPWAEKAIEIMASKGIISGTSETTFTPDAQITRADFMMLLTKTFGFQAQVSSNFADVQASDYYYDAVGIAKELGLAQGQGDNTFNPQAQISRQDMMVLLSRALGKAGAWQGAGMESDLNAFQDKDNIAAYAANDIAALVNAGLVEGSDNQLNPQGSTTRAESAVLLYRLYNLLYSITS